MKPSLPPGPWTKQLVSYPCLPAALSVLMGSIEQRLKRPQLEPARQAELGALLEALARLRTMRPDREVFEAALGACHTYGSDRSESFLAFVYTVMHQPLTDFAASMLRRMQSREDVEILAVDLVSALFTELTEAMLDGEDPENSSRLPQPGRTIPWLFQAIRHDAIDYCKSGANRIEQAVDPGPDEGYDQALDRLSHSLTARGENAVSNVELAERREAFLNAFEKATNSLKPRHREVLRLRELENASIEEIALQLQATPQQVLDLLQYGREKRAQLIATQLRSIPALADLSRNRDEVTALLKRVRLWSLTLGLRQLGVGAARHDLRPQLEDLKWPVRSILRRVGGASDSRGPREL